MVLPAPPSPIVAGDSRRAPIIVDDDCGGEARLPVMELPQKEDDESVTDVVVVVDQSAVVLAGPRSSARLLTKARINYSLIEHRSSSPSPERNERKNKGGTAGEDSCLRPAKKRAAPSLLVREDASGDSGEKSGGEAVTDSGVRGVVLETQVTKDMSAYARVKETLRQFNSIYLHYVQREQQRRAVDSTKNGKLQKNQVNRKVTKQVDDKLLTPTRRPDLKAVTEMQERKLILYPRKIGNLEGIDVGHRFYSRAEMVVLGFHCHWLNGIDYLRPDISCDKEGKKIGLPIAVSIIMSGQYEDDVDNLENVVYTGQGGNDLLGKKQQIRDQKLERGNLALKNNVEKKIPVRVTRGHASKDSYVGKVYTYDGLYEVVKYWAEKGVSGYTVYKFQLKRLVDQPLLTTNQVYFSGAQVPRSSKDVHGLVSEDISGGLEYRPIPATNVVDTPSLPPSGYIYCNALQIKENVWSPPVASGCNCKGSCVNPRECACATLNGSGFPYVQQGGGRLIEAKAVIFECGPACGCGPACINRASQQELIYQLEVFRTPNRGWGVRSWDHIPPGAPVCEYKGVLMSTDELDTVADDTFVFEIDCLQTMKGLDGRESRRGVVSANVHTYLDSSDDKIAESVPEFCIDAGPLGNVSRFINHSCQPNLFVQCVLSSHHNIKQARIVLFASEHIPPLQELTYDYGYALDSVVGSDGHIKKMPCFCGAVDCRKRLY